MRIVSEDSRRKNQERSKAWYDACPQRTIDNKRKWRAENLDKHRAQRQRRRAAHPDLYLAQQERYRIKYRVSMKAKAAQKKRDVIDAYGGKCACCGEKELVFLTIDHIGGGGREHRREIGGGRKIYSMLLREPHQPDVYRVLCFNCNFAMHVTKGHCPHQTSRLVGEGDAAWA